MNLLNDLFESLATFFYKIGSDRSSIEDIRQAKIGNELVAGCINKQLFV
jgi:hypothetical protein